MDKNEIISRPREHRGELQAMGAIVWTLPPIMTDLETFLASYPEDQESL